MSEQRRYAVLIAAHDAAGYIGETLASVASQSPAPSEVVVVDDASTDGTGDVARRHGARVIRNERSLGPGGARNLAFAATDAPVVAFIDADDKWEPGHIASCLPLLDDAAVGVAFSATRMFGRVNVVLTVDIPIGHAFDARSVLLSRNIVPQSGVLVRASEFTAVGGYHADFLLSEDYDLWLRLAGRTRFAYTGLTTCLRRIHDGQLSLERRRDLVSSAWNARMAAVSRWRALPDWSDALFTRQLVQAAEDDLGAVLWTGSSSELTSFLGVLDTIPLGDDGTRLSDRLGLGRSTLPWRRALLHARCRGRALARSILFGNA